MRELAHRQGAAFLIATHDSRLTCRCDRVIALLDGRISPHETSLPLGAAA
jgi:putative ABC transport system ATP-binding protein